MVSLSVIEALHDVLARHPELELAIVFGSAAVSAEHADSDVDMAVQAEHPLDVSEKVTLVGDFAAANGRTVDLVDLHTVGEPLLGQLLTHGRRLWGPDEACGRFLSRHFIDAVSPSTIRLKRASTIAEIRNSATPGRAAGAGDRWPPE